MTRECFSELQLEGWADLVWLRRDRSRQERQRQSRGRTLGHVLALAGTVCNKALRSRSWEVLVVLEKKEKLWQCMFPYRQSGTFKVFWWRLLQAINRMNDVGGIYLERHFSGWRMTLFMVVEGEERMKEREGATLRKICLTLFLGPVKMWFWNLLLPVTWTAIRTANSYWTLTICHVLC